nr:hypothetical protein [uncultured Arsenicibacter sp.]
MKITRQNYVKTVVPLAQKGFKGISSSTAQNTFKEIHDDLAHDTKSFSDYSRIDADKEVSALEALYYQKLSKYLNKSQIGRASSLNVAQAGRAKTGTRKADTYIDRELQIKTKIAKAKLLLLQSTRK